MGRDENKKAVFTIKFTEYEGENDLHEESIRDLARVSHHTLRGHENVSYFQEVLLYSIKSYFLSVVV